MVLKSMKKEVYPYDVKRTTGQRTTSYHYTATTDGSAWGLERSAKQE